MKLILLWLIMSPALWQDAVGQMETGGTIIVFNWSHDEIAIAADSRRAGQTGYRDNECKILALGNHLIFAAAGRRGRESIDGSLVLWDSYAIARQQFQRLVSQGASEKLPLRLARAWGQSVKQKLETDLSRDRAGTLSGIDGNRFISALFADFEKDGTMLIVIGTITYDASGKKGAEVNFTVQDVLRNPEPESRFLGHGEIAQEFFANTERAVKWQAKARQAFEGQKGMDKITFLAFELVDLTIKNLPPTSADRNGVPFSIVGGQIDAARLTAPRGIEWVAHKKGCPQDK